MIKKSNYLGACEGFINSIVNFCDRSAIEFKDKKFTYGELGQIVSNITITLENSEPDVELVGILSMKSLTTYAGPLGVLCSGKAYIPLSDNYPVSRILNIIDQTGLTTLIVGSECSKKILKILDDYDGKLTVLFPEELDYKTKDCLRRNDNHNFIEKKDLEIGPAVYVPESLKPDSTAYIIFTSGSTGTPKGVKISHNNIIFFLDNVISRYDLNEFDRISQVPDISFDLSVLDIFPTWEVGACLCPIPVESVLAPGKLIKDMRMTVWVSVPSAIDFLKKLKMLKPSSYPDIRFSFFCGEPLFFKSAQYWQEACPNSLVVNFYGPTEATCAISFYHYSNDPKNKELENKVIPVGRIFENQDFILLNENGISTEIDEIGELYLSGTQVSKGYYLGTKEQSNKFTQLFIKNKIWYKTGDLMTLDNENILHFKGRVDHQVKIRGYRVELEEIDSVIKNIKSCEQVVSIGWPIVNYKAVGIVTFVQQKSGNMKLNNDENNLLSKCKKYLPDYMIPQKIIFLESMPYNNNGKIDRNVLISLLKS